MMTLNGVKRYNRKKPTYYSQCSSNFSRILFFILKNLIFKKDDLCGCFRRAVPFVENLQNLNKIYFKDTKEKDQLIFSHDLFLSHRRLILNNTVLMYFV